MDVPDPQVPIIEPTAMIREDDPTATDTQEHTPAAQVVADRQLQAASSTLILRHAGGFALVYSMLHFYFFHLYTLLLHFNVAGRKQT
ncbi:hypothetical protein J3R83DRAFT_3675 [Lanmaoa asiatica]|nr:hypothetical protein J3R83DRAFT_3675 [Lanmaoa asiatica]